MQITDDRIENWTANPEQFVQDEDEESYSYSVRISGQNLIEEIASEFKKETANAVLKAIERHMQLACKLKEAGNANWWKLHEACLLAVSSVKPVLTSYQYSLFQFVGIPSQNEEFSHFHCRFLRSFPAPAS